MPLEEESALEALATAQDLTRETRDVMQRVHSMVARTEHPAQLKMITLTGADPAGNPPAAIKTDDVSGHSASIGLINPSPVTVYMGLPAGAPARPGGRSLSVPPGAVLVLPLSVGDLEIGADAAAIGIDGATGEPNEIVVWLLRFRSVQQVHFSRF